MRHAPVTTVAASLAAGLLAALIPAGPAVAAGPGHKVLLRNGEYAYVSRTPAKPSVTLDASRGSISGRVTGDGHPLRGICVAVGYPGYFDT